ncbi:YopX family protein [Streptococcus pyogenes]|uniref:YopX family protein n=1 Tax=Streptococcus TaxID=1301 RepID=UPI0030CDAF48
MIPKFRAYFEQYKRMIYSIGIVNQNMILVDFHDTGDTESLFITDRIHVMQSTGLFDKNGVEVFDGDIMFYEQDCYQYTLVKYDKDKLAFVLYDGCERLYHELWEPGEVIGNIYENPELLESVEE